MSETTPRVTPCPSCTPTTTCIEHAGYAMAPNPSTDSPLSAAEHTIEARGDEYPVPGESMPIESGGWWTPYTETTWGYFRFAIRPVEQPDGFLMFWHDAEGGHTASVILDAAHPESDRPDPGEGRPCRYACPAGVHWHAASPVPTDRPEPIDEERLRTAIGSIDGLQVYWLDEGGQQYEPADQRDDEDWADHLTRRILAAYHTEPGETT